MGLGSIILALPQFASDYFVDIGVLVMGLWSIIFALPQFISYDNFVGIGVLVMGLGSIVFALPQFTSGLYTFTGDDVTYCDIGANATACTLKDSLSNYKYVFFLGQLLHGAGAAPLYTLGVTYLDENLPVRSSSMYIGKYHNHIDLIFKNHCTLAFNFFSGCVSS